MTPPEPILAPSEEGTPPRRRLDSMIAGRRRASDASSSEASSSARSSTSSRSSRSAGRSEERTEEDEKPARSRRSAAPDEDASEDDRPRVRRTRRGGRSRSRAEDAPRAEGEAEATEPQAEDPTEEPAAVTETRPRTRSARTAAAPDRDVEALREALSRQESMIAELREGIEQLGTRIVTSGYRPRVAVFVDVPNLIYGYEGDGSLNMGRLLKLITEGRDLVRATAYSPVSDDPREPVEQQRFVAPFVPHEYRIVTKPLKRFSDGSIKGNFDVEMAVDMVMMADRVDVICIVSGDADFARAVEVVQQKGVRVEVVAFAGSTSIEMRALADHYVELDRVVKQVL
ncbi:MAG: NYN domain-containing protein [Dehalococcoidia bacterium]